MAKKSKKTKKLEDTTDMDKYFGDESNAEVEKSEGIEDTKEENNESKKKNKKDSKGKKSKDKGKSSKQQFEELFGPESEKELDKKKDKKQKTKKKRKKKDAKDFDEILGIDTVEYKSYNDVKELFVTRDDKCDNLLNKYPHFVLEMLDDDNPEITGYAYYLDKQPFVDNETNVLTYTYQKDLYEQFRALVQGGIIKENGKFHQDIIDDEGNLVESAISRKKNDYLELLACNGFNLTKPTREPYIMQAIKNDNPQAVQILATNGATLDIIFDSGRPLLQEMAVRNEQEIFKVLVTSGADIEKTNNPNISLTEFLNNNNRVHLASFIKAYKTNQTHEDVVGNLDPNFHYRNKYLSESDDSFESYLVNQYNEGDGNTDFFELDTSNTNVNEGIPQGDAPVAMNDNFEPENYGMDEMNHNNFMQQPVFQPQQPERVVEVRKEEPTVNKELKDVVDTEIKLIQEQTRIIENLKRENEALRGSAMAANNFNNNSAQIEDDSAYYDDYDKERVLRMQQLSPYVTSHMIPDRDRAKRMKNDMRRNPRTPSRAQSAYNNYNLPRNGAPRNVHVPRSVAPTPGAPDPNDTQLRYELLRHLKILFDEEVITYDEYVLEKRRIMSGLGEELKK